MALVSLKVVRLDLWGPGPCFVVLSGLLGPGPLNSGLLGLSAPVLLRALRWVLLGLQPLTVVLSGRSARAR